MTVTDAIASIATTKLPRAKISPPLRVPNWFSKSDSRHEEFDSNSLKHQQTGRKPTMICNTDTERTTWNFRAPQSSFLRLVRLLGAIQRQRKSLGELDQAALDDIGLTRSQADAEASRPVWDVPANWLK